MKPEPAYYAHNNLVFRRLGTGRELVAEFYGADDARVAGEYETSGDGRAEHVAALLNEKPFPSSVAPENASAVDVLAPFHEALSTSLHEAAGELHSLTERVADILRTPLASEHIEDRIPADVYAMIDAAYEAADAARGAAEVLHDAIPPDYERLERLESLGDVMTKAAFDMFERLCSSPPPRVGPRSNFGA